MSAARVVSLRLGFVVLCLAAVGLVGAGVASAEPGSMDEAVEVGDPAASAPVAPLASVWMYNGVEVSEAEAMELGLSCLQSATQFTCKDTAEEVENLGEEAESRAARSSLACGVYNLMLYRHKQYEGTAIALAYFNSWYDVPGDMNNETTSYRTGEASAHLSDFSGGGGWWYPGATGVCDYHSNISQPYPEWNDRISSRYRF